MAESLENKRAGRETELRKNMKAALERYEAVFGKVLSTSQLKDYLEECEKRNRNNFLTDRLGVLSDVDVKYLKNILLENPVNEAAPSVDEDIEEIEDPDSFA